jgi:hypothetical protein
MATTPKSLEPNTKRCVKGANHDRGLPFTCIPGFLHDFRRFNKIPWFHLAALSSSDSACMACWKPVFETVVYELWGVLYVSGVCYDHHTNDPHHQHTMDPPPRAFEPVTNNFGITQLEWDSPALTAESWGLPTIELTWNPDDITSSMPLEQLPPVSTINIMLCEWTLFVAFCAGKWLDHLPNQLTMGYMNDRFTRSRFPYSSSMSMGALDPYWLPTAMAALHWNLFAPLPPSCM